MTKQTEGLGRVLAGMLIATAVAFGLAACGSNGGNSDDAAPPAGSPAPPAATQNMPKDDSDSKPAYDGAYDAKFREWAGDHEGDVVTITGHVKTVLNENALTIMGTNGTEDFLVVGKGKAAGIKAGDNVSVTGKVHKAFDLPGVEDEIDVDFNDDNVLQGFDRDPYVVATDVAVQ